MKLRFFILLCFVLFLIVAFVPKINYAARNSIYGFYVNAVSGGSPPLMTQNRNAKSFKNKELLTFTMKDSAGFDEFTENYTILLESGEDEYHKNRKWRKAELEFGGEKFKVKIKNHGKLPNKHKDGKYVSLAVKSKKEIFGVKRFNLIIYKRYNRHYDLVKVLSNEFRLINRKDKLVRVKLGDWEESLFYIEYRIESKFPNYFRSLKNPKTNESSFVCIDDYGSITRQSMVLDSFAWYRRESLINSIIKNDSLRPSKFNKVLLGVNNCIINGDKNGLAKYFDLDYISSFLAVKTIGGFSSHGLGSGNNRMLLDTLEWKFYPLIHRDCFLLPLDTNNLENLLVNSGDTPIILYDQLYEVSGIKKLVNSKINDFLERHLNWEIEYQTVQKEHDELHDIPWIQKWFYIHNFNTLRFPSDKPQNIIDYNIKLLRSAK